MFQLIIIIIGLTSVLSHHHHFYRKDYTYFEEYDAFYKLHWSDRGNAWDTAFMACDDEGAQLFYPKEENEWEIVRNLSASSTFTVNNTDVLIGIHDEIGKGEYATVDGTKLDECYRVYLSRNDNSSPCGVIYRGLNQLITKSYDCDVRLPFVCEMEAKRI